MKKTLFTLITGTIILSACGNDDEQKKLEQEIKSLEKSSKEYKDEKKSLEKENEKLKESVKDKEDELKKLKDESGSSEEDNDTSSEDKKEKSESETKTKQTSDQSEGKPFPNTISKSTNGDVALLNDIKDKSFEFEDSGMHVNIKHLQIFHVTNMPEGQVLLFDGAKEGYVLLYETVTENTTEEKLYYDNSASVNDGDKIQRSDYASFIPDAHNEQHMKKSKENADEYQPGEKTKSLKSIPMSTDTYEALKEKKATFNINGGVSKTATFDDASNKEKSFELEL